MTDKEKADYWIKNQRCSQCGKQDAYTLGGRHLCFSCAEYSKEWYRKNKEKYAERSSKIREDRKSKGLCIRCGNKKSDLARSLCESCREKDKNRHRRKAAGQPNAHETAKSESICYWCKKSNSNGLLYCDECRKHISNINREHAQHPTEKQIEARYRYALTHRAMTMNLGEKKMDKASYQHTEAYKSFLEKFKASEDYKRFEELCLLIKKAETGSHHQDLLDELMSIKLKHHMTLLNFVTLRKEILNEL